jgi:hypothetical protein
MKPHPFAGLAAGLAASLAPMLFSASAWCQTQPRPQPPLQTELLPQPKPAVVVKDFDIFLDPPTGFVFVKLPQGWKFVGKVAPSALASLPGNVITSLLPDERDGVVASDSDQPVRR